VANAAMFENGHWRGWGKMLGILANRLDAKSTCYSGSESVITCQTPTSRLIYSHVEFE